MQYKYISILSYKGSNFNSNTKIIVTNDVGLQ